MNVVIYHPPSPGCKTSAEVIRKAFTENGVNIILVEEYHELPEHILHKKLSLDVKVDVVIFFERIINHPALAKATHRILIPNLEWLDKTTLSRLSICTHIWHQTQFSLKRLAPLFPNVIHDYLGFTSITTGERVQSYDSFLHLRGKLLTKRNTNAILQLWGDNATLPQLYVHFYENIYDGISYPRWLSNQNVHMRIGWLDRTEHLKLNAQHGIHLCTSEVEGFGHYINEAREMGAVIITTDAPPMNELINNNSGILVRTSNRYSMNFGYCHSITSQDLAVAIDKVNSLSIEERRAIGDAARCRFLADDARFYERAKQLFDKLLIR